MSKTESASSIHVDTLTLSMLGKKKISRRHFYIFSQKIGFGIVCKLSPEDDFDIYNSHEMSMPIFWEKNKNIISCHLLNLPTEWLRLKLTFIGGVIDKYVA